MRTHRISHIVSKLSIAGFLLASCAVAPSFASPADAVAPSNAALSKSVRTSLVTLPFFSVFDNFEYQIVGDVVTLSGQVTRPSLRADAEAVVKRLPGVKSVVNNIETLPLSRFDDQVRLEAYRRIYGAAPLNRYAVQAVPPIHIIVKNGRITLKGVVATRMERNIAQIKANQVSNAFSVANNLLVEKELR